MLNTIRLIALGVGILAVLSARAEGRDAGLTCTVNQHTMRELGGTLLWNEGEGLVLVEPQIAQGRVRVTLVPRASADTLKVLERMSRGQETSPSERARARADMAASASQILAPLDAQGAYTITRQVGERSVRLDCHI